MGQDNTTIPAEPPKDSESSPPPKGSESPPPSSSPPPPPPKASPPPKESPPPNSSPPSPNASPPPKEAAPPPKEASPPPKESPPPPPLLSPPPPNAPPPAPKASIVSPPPPPHPSISPSPPPPPNSGSSSSPSSPLPPLRTPPPPVPANATSPPNFGSSPVLPAPGLFSPPPSVPGKPITPSKAIPHSSGSTGNSPASSDPSSSNDTVLIAGIVLLGAIALAFVFVWLLSSRKKKKQSYYMDPERPNPRFPKGNISSSTQSNSTNTGENVVKVSPPPGLMGGPGGVWGAQPLAPQANSSSENSSSVKPPPSPSLGGFNKSQFSYEELADATSGFSQANLLGQGGFGYVHKGVLPDGRVVAVKSLKLGSGQGEREFQAEVEIISRIHHRHLVSLVGYCIASGQRMLVYEFVPNKTLEFHLHGKGHPVMDWGTRLRVALGSAKGLAYLHEDCYPKIIHRDIKAANILLDDKFEAKVADFGLAKLASDNYTHVSTRVMGTFGYLAPEYASSGKLTEKSDVFSFGVMLLELITGRKPVDPTNKLMEDSLVDWARPLLANAMEDGNYNELVDPFLEGNYVAHEMARMIACAASSIRHSSIRRPKMSQIVRALGGDLSLDDLNGGNKQKRNGEFGSQGSSVGSQTDDSGMYNADTNKFKKIINAQDYNSSEFGATSDYGLNLSSSSSSESEGHGISQMQKPEL